MLTFEIKIPYKAVTHLSNLNSLHLISHLENKQD